MSRNSRNIYGARLSLLVGFAATAVAVLVATAVGGLSGFVGGRLDMVTQRFVDAWMAIPGLLLLMTIMSILGTGALQIIIVLGLTYGIGSSRVIRGAVIGIKENAYFQAAQAVGSSALAHGAAPRAAERAGAHHRHLQHHHRRGHHHRGCAELSGLRVAAERAELGRPVEPRGPQCSRRRGWPCGPASS